MADVVKNDGKVATQAYNEICDYLTGTGLSAEDAKRVAELVVNLDKNLKVIDESDPNVPNEDGEYPILEAASDVLVDAVDLAILSAKLKIDSEKFQAFVRKTGLDYLNNDLDSKMAERMEKIKESLKKMDKAAKAGLFSKIFGWLMVAVSILLAVVSCGAAGGLVVGAVVGAVVALSMQVLSETGAMEKITKALVKVIQKVCPFIPKRAAEILAAVLVARAVIALSVLTGQIGTSVAKVLQIGKQVTDTVFKVVEEVVNTTMKVIGQLLQCNSTAANFISANAQSEVTTSKALLEEMMKSFERMSDELEEIIEQLTSGEDTILKILGNYNQNQINLMRSIRV